MSEKSSEPDIEPRRSNDVEVPGADRPNSFLAAACVQAYLEAEPEAKAGAEVGPIVVGIVRSVIGVIGTIIGIRSIVRLIVRLIVRTTSVAVPPISIANVLHPISDRLA